MSFNDINPSQELLNIYRGQIRLLVIVSIINVVGLYLWIVFANPLTEPITISTQLMFGGLMGLHVLLHWWSAKVQRRVRLAIIYIFVQGTLLFYLGMLIHYPLITMFLGPLVAEIVVVFEALWLLPVGIVLGLVLQGISSVTYALTMPYMTLPTAYLPLLKSAAFGLILTVWSYLPAVVAYFLVIRARRQTGRLLVRLDNAHRQLAVYAEQVEQLTVTAERARMARELHDTLAQGVAGLILQLEVLDSQLVRGDNAIVATTLAQIKDHARGTLKSSRLAIDDLRLIPNQPTMILHSIDEEVHHFSALTGVPCTLDAPPSLVLPTSTTEHTLRFVSEGLANVAKHATASHVDVRVKIQEREVLLEIQDDGVGFDPATANQRIGHYGLLGLQERARLVGGKFEVESALRKGTTLRLYLPKRS